MNNIDCILMCNGKCGSSTLLSTMIANGFNTIKVHNKKFFINEFKYDGLIDTININSSNKPLYIIDCYRTPIEREISGFFENIHRYVPDYKNKSCNELIRIFNTFCLNYNQPESINEIFDEYKIKRFTQFDFNKGYIRKQVGNMIFIKLLFKDIHKWDIILSNIFNKPITITNGNLSKDKEYYTLYENFKKNYKVPKAYINRLQTNEAFKIYNTKEEQILYLNKWLELSY
jgi:hypothetical protein